MSKKDYYEILGVEKNSSKEEIKKASRKTERKGAVIGREVGKQEERVAIADAERKRVPGEGPVSPPSFMTKPD